MFVLANLLDGITTVLDIALSIYGFCLFAVVIVSWVAPRSMHPAIVFLRRITEPVLYRIRRAIPFVYQAGFDFSPVVAFLLIMFIKRFLIASLYQLAANMR